MLWDRVLLIAFILVLLAGCQSPPTPAARSWDLPAGTKTARVNGYDMTYFEQGAGVPIILVHGLGNDYRYFEAQMAPLAERYRVIAVSLRHSYPERWKGNGEYLQSQRAADLVEFIRQLNVGPAHVVGHSLGGTTAMYAAKAAPQLVRSLTLAESGVGMPAFTPPDPAARERRRTLFRAVAEKLDQGETDGGLELFINTVNGAGAWSALPEAAKQVLRDNAWALPAADKDEDRWPPFTCEDARRLAIPVLLLGGEKSPAGFGRVLDGIQACLTRVERRVIINSSHAMPRMNAPAFNGAVMAFVSAN